MLLPQLAAYFDVSVDALLGYEPQLTREQIDRLYKELSQGFAEQPLAEMLERQKTGETVLFLLFVFVPDMCALAESLHHACAGGAKCALQEILKLCGHITENCEDFSIREETVVMRAQVNLILGRGKEAIQELEEARMLHSLRRSTGNICFCRGYLMTGEQDTRQQAMRSSACMRAFCLLWAWAECIWKSAEQTFPVEATLERMEKLMEAYALDKLNPNAALQFYYRAALVYCQKQDKKKAVFYLEKCADCIKNLLGEKEMLLHGDDYFYLLEKQLSGLGVNENAPRDRKLVLEDIRSFCDNPVFSILQEEPEFIRLKKQLQEVQ